MTFESSRDRTVRYMPPTDKAPEVRGGDHRLLGRDALTVYFDYTCPFAYRAHRWLDELDSVDITWCPFSLLERNYRGDGPPVWRLPERADDISLLLFAGHCWVEADHANLAQYRHAAFGAWHETDGRLDLDDVLTLAQKAGAAGGEDALRAHFFDAEAVHDQARHLGVFGSPTLVFSTDEAAFVKRDAPPPPERAHQVLDAVAAMAALPSVLEVKRPIRPPKPDASQLRPHASPSPPRTREGARRSS